MIKYEMTIINQKISGFRFKMIVIIFNLRDYWMNTKWYNNNKNKKGKWYKYMMMRMT